MADNPFDKLIDAAPSQNYGEIKANPFEKLIERENAESDAILKKMLSSVSNNDPDKVGEAQKIQQSLNLPPDVKIDSDEAINKLKEKKKQIDIFQNNLAKQSPFLAQQLRDPAFAAIAHDDTERLGVLETVFDGVVNIPNNTSQGFEKGRLVDELGRLGNLKQTGQSSENIDARIGEINSRIQELEGDGAGFWENASEFVGQMSKTMPKAFEFGLGTGMSYATAVGIAGQVGPQIATPEEIITVPSAFVGGFFAGFVAKMGAESYVIESGHSYLEMIEEGIDKDVAQYASSGVGIVNAALEVVGVSVVAAPFKKALMKRVTKDVAQAMKKPGTGRAFAAFAGTYAKTWTAEVSTEVLQEISAIAGAEIAKEFSEGEFEALGATEEGRAQISARLIGIFEKVGKGMALLAIPGASVSFYSNYTKAKASTRETAFIEQLSTLSNDSKTKKRNPTAFQAFIQNTANGKDVTDIYIDAEILNQQLKSNGVTMEQLEAVSPQVAEELKEINATGGQGDVKIQTGEYAAKIAGTDLGTALQPHMRVTEDSMSATEAAQFVKDRQAMTEEALRIVEEKNAEIEGFKESAAQVRKSILDQIKATGAYTNNVASNYADFVRDFVVTQSSELNILPADFYSEYMYKIVNQQQAARAPAQPEAQAAQQLFDNNGNARFDTPEFIEFFGQSKLVNEDGSPKVIYHGTADSIEAFDFEHPNRNDTGWLGTGVYATDDPTLAKIYAEQKAQKKRTGRIPDDGVGANIMPMFARLENPYIATLDEKQEIRLGGRKAADGFRDRLVAEGYDGVIMPNNPGGRDNSNEIVIFDNKAIKSQFNSGTWSNETANILQQANTDAVAIEQAQQSGIDETTGKTLFQQGKLEPRDTVQAYKLFRIDPNRPGELFPLFVNANTPVKTNEWIEAEVGPQVASGKVKSKIGELAFRPGWHSGDLPMASHIGGKTSRDKTKPDYRPDNQVWALVELPADVDWQTTANERATRNKNGEIIPRTAHITDQIPNDGHYRYKTNPNMTGDWLISGSMKVIRVLSDNEVTAINAEAGLADLPRVSPRVDEGVFYQRGREQRPGKPVPDSVLDVSKLENSFEFAGSQQFATNRDLKVAIQDRVNTAAKAAGVDLSDFSVATEKYLVDAVLSDALFAIQTNPNAVGWYDEKITKALRLVSLIHPEVATDPEAKFAFTWALAVTSNGLKVNKNFELAEKAYAKFKADGRMPTDIGDGTATIAINGGLDFYNTMIDQYGFEAFEGFMTTMHSVKEVEAFTGKKVSGENKTTMVYGAAILGPKIGNGFFANLYGHFEQLTMDRWLMRTWGRMTGTLITDYSKQAKVKRQAMKSLIKGMTKEDKAAFEKIIKMKIKMSNIDEVAVAIQKSSMKPANRVAMAQIAPMTDEANAKVVTDTLGEPKANQKRMSIGDELRKSGNMQTVYLDGQKEAPQGPPERAQIRKVFAQALNILQQEQKSLTMADLQALLWYPEKRLYDAAKVSEQEGNTGYEDQEAPDYANAAAALARSRGVSDADVNATIKDVDNELKQQTSIQPGRTQPGDGDRILNQRDRRDGYAGGSLAPLQGAPTIDGATGPDIRLVTVAERYARDNGIDLRRQREYVRVNTDLATRIANAYEQMEHTPNDPVVLEAYENLIKQTTAQYQALIDAGYQFYFFDDTTDPYGGNPWNSMRELRANQTLAVYASETGFGSEETVSSTENPMLADTGLTWPSGSLDGEPKRVLANDLFRAVHDAFGHGIEGSGFRYDGEENAWQAHIRLFTGSARAAITTETRGQNSWLNFGPYGPQNRTASLEETIFAEQKTGLMPAFTYEEGVAGDMETITGDGMQQSEILSQEKIPGGARGGFDPTTLTTILNKDADYSTFLHETAHFMLTVMADLAGKENATPKMVNDFQTLLDFFGVENLDTWNKLSLNEQRKYHESFAYNFEIYLFEGKAPNVKMQSLFDRFSTFLRRIYRSIRDELNVIYRQENGVDLPILTDEVRGVMDRMLASEDQINQAEQVYGMKAMFQTQQESGMDDATWAEYTQIMKDAHDSAVTDMTKASMRQVKWLSNARSRVIKELQATARTQRKKVSEEEAQKLQSEKIYQIIGFLKRGEFVNEQGERVAAKDGHKISIDDIKALMPELTNDQIKKLGFGKYGMVAKDGMPVSIVAEMFGYETGQSMINALLNARPMQEVITERTDARMLNEFSDLTDPRQQELQVQEALHNEARARFISVELRFLSKSMQPVRYQVAAARQVAKELLAKKKLREIRPSQFARNEAKAVKAAEAAMRKGDSAGAVSAKRAQLIQNQLAREAIEVHKRYDKAQKLFKQVFKADKKLAKNRNMDLVNAARSILAAYNMGPKVDSPLDYVEKLKAYNPDMFAQVEPLIMDASRMGGRDIKDLTGEEFDTLNDMIQSLWYQSRRDKQITIDGQTMELEGVIGELNLRLEEIGIPDTPEGSTEAPGRKARIMRSINTTKAQLRRVEHWADSLDGAAGVGAFTKYIWRPIRGAVDLYRVARNNYTRRYAEMIAKLDLGKGKIIAGEFGYTFGNENGGLGKAELLGAMLHMGNESNLRKLLVGRNWAVLDDNKEMDTAKWDTFIDRMIDEGVLTKADFDFLQSVWDMTEEMKPLAQKAHNEIYGYYFNEVEAVPITNQFGTFRGGYVPAKTDPFMVRDAQRNAKLEELEGDFRQALPSTGNGFTKGRVEYNQPLSLDVRLMTKHIDDVLRFAYLQPAIKDVTKILRNRQFADNLTAIDPGAIEEMLIPWLNRSARQTTIERGINQTMDKFWGAVRNRTGVGIMFANITNALQQITGYFPAALKVEGKYLRSGLAQYMKAPMKAQTEIAELSPFMADRQRNQIFDIQETLNDLLLNPSKYAKIQKWAQRHGYFLQQAFQNQVDTVVWIATYNKTLAELPASTKDVAAEKEAIARADANVRMTQDSLTAEDLAAFQVGSPFYKTMLQFGGYFNMLANLNATAYTKIFRDLGWRGNKGQLFMTYLLGFGLPMLVADAIVRAVGGDFDDEDDDGYLDEVAGWFFGSQLRGAAALVPFGTIAIVPLNSFNDLPYDDRMTTSPSISLLEAATVGTVKTAINIIDEDKDVTGKNVRDVLTLLSLVTGIPLTVLGRPIGYAVDVESGKIDPTSDADFLRGLVTGKASPASR